MKKWIFGLGNPEKRYAFSRHNAGFIAIDELAKKWNVEIKEKKFLGIFGVKKGKPEVFLVKPLTYMNHSGECVKRFAEEFDIKIENILIIHDDMDIPLGTMRFKRKNGSGGHKGIESIIQNLGRVDFNRLRLGIGRPPPGVDPVDYVLEKFSEEEGKKFMNVLKLLPLAVEIWITHGISEAMNSFNNTKLYHGNL